MSDQGQSRSRNNNNSICGQRGKGVIIGVERQRGPGHHKIQPEGDTVRTLDMITKQADPLLGAEISGGQTQEQINEQMTEIVKQFPKVFSGLGRATGVPDIQIEMDKSVMPVQQKQRQTWSNKVACGLLSLVSAFVCGLEKGVNFRYN